MEIDLRSDLQVVKGSSAQIGRIMQEKTQKLNTTAFGWPLDSSRPSQKYLRFQHFQKLHEPHPKPQRSPRQSSTGEPQEKSGRAIHSSTQLTHSQTQTDLQQRYLSQTDQTKDEVDLHENRIELGNTALYPLKKLTGAMCIPGNFELWQPQ